MSEVEAVMEPLEEMSQSAEADSEGGVSGGVTEVMTDEPSEGTTGRFKRTRDESDEEREDGLSAKRARVCFQSNLCAE